MPDRVKAGGGLNNENMHVKKEAGDAKEYIFKASHGVCYYRFAFKILFYMHTGIN
ncbi:hypothetical protein BN137_1666 [Cronobacter condimenti 1330]|uniref:Uncharacterized protein n=1 Tax=Cronobacter condimenti 1330 TaxID=1073999 RepID=K7ZZT6_9ENTR|nr:hypothetical protein BN137_1666 [Cronobacter condimenti 1330]